MGEMRYILGGRRSGKTLAGVREHIVYSIRQNEPTIAEMVKKRTGCSPREADAAAKEIVAFMTYPQIIGPDK